jgi:5-methylcytosine-specific restriction protein A
MTRTWTTPTPRKTDRKLRAAIFVRQDGKCACCPTKLHLKRWILDHVTPLEEGGADDETNLQAICEPCSKAKTSVEATERASYRIKRDKHAGIVQKRSSFPCGRGSKFKKKMDGTVVPR